MPDGGLFQRAVAGQPFGMAADDWNAVCDYMETVPRSVGMLAKATAHFDPCICWVRNDSEADRERGSILAIDGKMFATIDALGKAEWFRSRPLAAVVPTVAGNYHGWACILLDSIPEDGVGRAVVGGVFVAKISMGQTWHECADIKDGDCTQLQSCNEGAFEILGYDAASLMGIVRWRGRAREFWAEINPDTITDSPTLISPGAYGKYHWREMEEVGSGTWAPVADGRTSTATPAMMAYHTLESYTSGWRMSFPIFMQGVIVRMHELAPLTATDAPRYEFVEPCVNETTMVLAASWDYTHGATAAPFAQAYLTKANAVGDAQTTVSPSFSVFYPLAIQEGATYVGLPIGRPGDKIKARWEANWYAGPVCTTHPKGPWFGELYAQLDKGTSAPCDIDPVSGTTSPRVNVWDKMMTGTTSPHLESGTRVTLEYSPEYGKVYVVGANCQT